MDIVTGLALGAIGLGIAGFVFTQVRPALTGSLDIKIAQAGPENVSGHVVLSARRDLTIERLLVTLRCRDTRDDTPASEGRPVIAEAVTEIDIILFVEAGGEHRIPFDIHVPDINEGAGLSVSLGTENPRGPIGDAIRRYDADRYAWWVLVSATTDRARLDDMILIEPAAY